jgi:hypothetical protein
MDEETENLVLRMAKENPSCYDRILGALANLGQKLSDRTVGNILRRQEVLLRSESTPRAGKTSSALIWTS